MTAPSEEVGEKFAGALGDGPSRATLAAQRVLVMEMAQRSFRPRARPNAWTLALASVPVAAMALLLVFYATRERPFEARFAGTDIAVDAHLIASEKTSDTLDFSDGSQVVFEPRARATLAALTPEHAGVRLDAGRVSASIRKHPGMTWTVTAGPYAVHVIGTHFSVEWHERDRAFEVFVREGRVRVTGGDLPAAGVFLHSGGRLERRAAKPAQPPAPIQSPVPDTAAGRAPPTEKSPDSAPVGSGSSAISALATKGKYKEALALAEKQGFERLTAELPENDLLLLANAARYSGDASRARQALTKLRQRFAGRPGADLAALYLAKIAEDMAHDPSEAIVWLRVFLRSSPSGDLASGARASLMSLLLRTGDKPAARAVAQDYLRFHANGPHADEARALAE